MDATGSSFPDWMIPLPLPEEELDVDHCRSDVLHHVCDEVKPVAWTGSM